MARPPKPKPSLRRSFVTPEGVDLRIELASAGARAGAFMLDLLMMLAVLIIGTIVIGTTAVAAESTLLSGLWLIGFFFLRNGWFTLFEMGGRGATLGKRIVGLRVVARDGSRLTGGAVIARNAMREIEFFLPISFFFSTIFQSGTDKMISLLALVWSGVFLFFPLFNRDRLRVGDLLAGTWVVQPRQGEAGPGHRRLARADRPVAPDLQRPRAGPVRRIRTADAGGGAARRRQRRDLHGRRCDPPQGRPARRRRRLRVPVGLLCGVVRAAGAADDGRQGCGARIR